MRLCSLFIYLTTQAQVLLSSVAHNECGLEAMTQHPFSTSDFVAYTQHLLHRVVQIVIKTLHAHTIFCFALFCVFVLLCFLRQFVCVALSVLELTLQIRLITNSRNLPASAS